MHDLEIYHDIEAWATSFTARWGTMWAKYPWCYVSLLREDQTASFGFLWPLILLLRIFQTLKLQSLGLGGLVLTIAETKLSAACNKETGRKKTQGERLSSFSFISFQMQLKLSALSVLKWHLVCCWNSYLAFRNYYYLIRNVKVRSFAVSDWLLYVITHFKNRHFKLYDWLLLHRAN